MALAVPSLSMTSPLISTFQVLTTGVAVLPCAERLRGMAASLRLARLIAVSTLLSKPVLRPWAKPVMMAWPAGMSNLRS